MPIKVLILLAYGVGLVIGFIIARLYPKRTPESLMPSPVMGLLVYILGFIVGYLLGLFSCLI